MNTARVRAVSAACLRSCVRVRACMCVRACVSVRAFACVSVRVYAGIYVFLRAWCFRVCARMCCVCASSCVYARVFVMHGERTLGLSVLVV